jgi:hypothetical protein
MPTLGDFAADIFARHYGGATRPKVSDTPDPGYNRDDSILSGLVSRDTRPNRRARNRSEVGRSVNTLANSRNGGGSATYRPRGEDMSGAARITPPTASGVLSRTPHGMTIARQHMATVTDPDQAIRTAVGSHRNMLNDSGTNIPPEATNVMWPGK